METTYILTAELDGNSYAWLDDLRRQHFPAERNFLPAHLTLFHKLSPAQVSRLRFIDLPKGPVELYFDRIMFLGFGVAVHVQSPGLERLRDAARAAAGDELSLQDRQTWNPHVTIQNKAAAERARKLQQTLEANFSKRHGAATGLLVWEYLGGPWKRVDCLTFMAAPNEPRSSLFHAAESATRLTSKNAAMRSLPLSATKTRCD